MHMADALISPTVGGTFWAVTAGTTAVALRRLGARNDRRVLPLAGVLGAFVFAAQMINFSIPGTGSSGHLGGGILLASLLGPWAGFLAIVCVLAIQALLFADGGLLAFGCNAFNLGVVPALLVWPLLMRPFQRRGGRLNLLAGSLLAAVVALQLGAFGVVLQTLFSGKTELPFRTFLLLMQPIHLAIGFVEGLITAAVLTYVDAARPEILRSVAEAQPLPPQAPLSKPVTVFALLALLTGGVLAWFASTFPDGLEWSIEKTAGTAELETQGPVHAFFGRLQERISVLPDYDFKPATTEPQTSESSWPAVSVGTSLAGILGAVLTGLLVVLAAAVARLLVRHNNTPG